MRKFNKFIGLFVGICMLITHFYAFSPAKAEAAPNSDQVEVSTDLFAQKTTINGRYYEIFRIPGIIVTHDGTLIAYCEARTTTSDWADIDILMMRSTDNGQTWSAPVKLVEAYQPGTR
ncbi:sialidase family protein [Paenibacillus arenilitoris]|uniref:exo-alpha-sialidase n=1 Tax=Paenibacillus arenilitoris TaxID=2772299 RepID=A0A927CLG9_9BACL|nr:sialidase family protein [Paenibacillus arenilitoris]MBD2868987.1 exo-alpha-sialidase [Paenibacillus arenilitoris]